jgi:site-specific recombinase XerD
VGDCREKSLTHFSEIKLRAAIQTDYHKERFVACCQKAGPQDFIWHCLRDTFASRLVMPGVPLRRVQELMGHQTIAMPCRYAHLAPEDLQDDSLKADGWGKSHLSELAPKLTPVV